MGHYTDPKFPHSISITRNFSSDKDLIVLNQ